MSYLRTGTTFATFGNATTIWKRNTFVVALAKKSGNFYAMNFVNGFERS